ncbi:MAG: hypothetical protein Q4A83_05350 [Bacillota bacterium]|nr:hypothetical protein [Bacillota bacterium]
MRFWKRLFTLILAAVMLFSVSGCGFLNYDTFSNAFDGHGSGGTKFGDMEYVHPEVDEIRSKVDSICDMLDSDAGYSDVADALDEFYTLYWNFYTMYTLAEIRSDLNTSDKYYGREYDYCSGEEANVTTMFTELMVACANSSLSAKLDSRYFGGILAENYSGSYETGFEKLNSLYARESALLTQYRSLLVEFYDCADQDEAYRTYNPDMCQIYIDLVKVRRQIAEECGYSSYEEMAYEQFGREYSPDDIAEYIAAIKKYIVPLLSEARDSDILSDAYYSLRDSEPEDSLAVVKAAVSSMDTTFSRSMDFMESCELYDISDSPNKLETSYVVYIDDYNAPFLFVKSTGYEEDILSIAHEFGHFTDSYENFDMNSNLDTSETLSQGMEYMLLCNLSSKKLASRLTDYKMTDTLFLYSNQGCFNEFEHRVFALPESELTVDKVNSIYAECALEFGFGDDYGDVLGLSWIDVSHFFDYPFYVISYCVSDSAAFSMYCMELDKAGSGLDTYLRVLDDAENMDFLELLDSAGMGSPITADTIKEIAEVIADKLELSA